MLKPVDLTECTCDQCGIEFEIGRRNPEPPNDYLIPKYCPMCGAPAKFLKRVTTSFTVGKRKEGGETAER